MATLYSAFLFGGFNEGTGTYTSTTVPSGFIWVVRDVVVLGEPRSDIYPQFVFSWYLRDAGELPILRIPIAAAAGGVTYHWAGHQVVATGSALVAVVQGPGWSWRVSGFQLTTP